MSGRRLQGGSVGHATRSRGLTLVELLIVLILTTLVGAIIYQMFRAASDVLSSVYGLGTVQMETTLLKTYFSRDAMMVMDFPATCCPASTPPFTHLQKLKSAANNGRATLILTVPSLDPNGQILLDANLTPYKYDQIVYDFNRTDGLVHRITYPDPSSSRAADAPTGHIVARSIKEVEFRCPYKLPDTECTAGDFGADLHVTAERIEGQRAFKLDLGGLGSSWSSRLANSTLGEYTP